MTSASDPGPGDLAEPPAAPDAPEPEPEAAAAATAPTALLPAGLTLDRAAPFLGADSVSRLAVRPGSAATLELER